MLVTQEHSSYKTKWQARATFKATTGLRNPVTYEQFLDQLEILFPTTMSGAGNPLPMRTGDIEIVSGKQLSAEDLGQCDGMIIEADPLVGVVNAQVQGINDLTLLDNAGIQRRRMAS